VPKPGGVGAYARRATTLQFVFSVAKNSALWFFERFGRFTFYAVSCVLLRAFARFLRGFCVFLWSFSAVWELAKLGTHSIALPIMETDVLVSETL